MGEAGNTNVKAPAVLVSGVVLSQPAGGVRRHNAELLPRLAERLASRGGRLAVLTGPEELPFALPNDVERIPTDVPAGPPLRRVLQEGRALTRAARAASDTGQPFDLIHTAHLPVPRTLPLPYTITQHDLRALQVEGAPFTRRFLARGVIGRAVQQASAVFTVSETMRSELVSRFRLDPDSVRVVSNAGDHFAPLPRAPKNDAALVAVGHLEPRKNLELLLHALATDTELPDLRLFGRAKPGEHERLTGLAQNLGVANRVYFEGPFEDEELPEIYAQAACVLVPSRVEGFGMVALEAQLASAPLAVSSAGALPEVAGEGVPQFAPDDVPGCVRAIHAALAQPGARLAEHAQRASRPRWDTSADAWAAGLARAYELTRSDRP